MWSKITNPETGRKVSINGAIGKRILKNYMYQLSGGATWVTEEERENTRAKNKRKQVRENAKRERVARMKKLNQARKKKRALVAKKARIAARAQLDPEVFTRSGGGDGAQWVTEEEDDVRRQKLAKRKTEKKEKLDRERRMAQYREEAEEEEFRKHREQLRQRIEHDSEEGVQWAE